MSAGKVAAMNDPIANVIADKTGLEVTGHKSIGASGWSAQAQYTASDGTKFFCKTSRRSAKEMFEGEALGLEAMYATGSLRIPKVIGWGDTSNGSYLVTEHLNFGGRADQAEMGRQLALMHKAPPKDGDGKFGFPVDNTIGGTPQPNPWTENWVDFFREHRLMHQVNLTGNSRLQKLAQPVADSLEMLFEGIEVQPATLHGDLWSGNMASVDGQPAVFDPAVYYGHAEAEFGMSWCAGFGPAFWEAYFAENPKQAGFEKRRDLYLVYHYLNHYNLFGSGYAGESERLLRRLQKQTSTD